MLHFKTHALYLNIKNIKDLTKKIPDIVKTL
jgi:hypothetical protein